MMVVTLTSMFEHYNFQEFDFDLSPTWCNNYFTCPFKFRCAKILNLKPVYTYKSYLIEGSLFHKIAELFFKYIKFDKINYYDEKTTKHYMMNVCLSLIPDKIARYRERIDVYLRNFVDYEYERMEAIFDLLGSTKEAFYRFYIPYFREKQQSLEDQKRGIRFKIDLCYRIPKFLYDNKIEELMLGDYKTGKSYDDFLDESVNRQLIFPIPFLNTGRVPRYVAGIYVHENIKVKLREVSGQQFYGLKLEFDKILNSIKNKEFPKTYKFCKWCEYMVYCFANDGIYERIKAYRRFNRYDNVQKDFNDDDDDLFKYSL